MTHTFISKTLIISGCALSLSLAACSGTKESLGLTKKSPDEFLVVKRAPLEMPPDFRLRPPVPGAERPQETSTENIAKETVFGVNNNDTQVDAPSSSSAAGALLQSAGAPLANENIRSIVDSENDELAEKNKPVTQKLLGIGRDKDPATTVVNPVEESARIQENKESGKPVTEGETPTIEQ